MEHICKWNEYIPNLLTGMENMKDSGNYVDATLVCEGNSIKVHKLILSNCSVLFHDMFLSNPCAHPIIILQDMKFSVLQAIVDFVYRGEIGVQKNDMELLLKAAKALQIKGLSSICKDTILKAMSDQSTVESHNDKGLYTDEDSYNDNELLNDTFMNESSPESTPSPKRKRKRSLEYNMPVETKLEVENDSDDNVEFNSEIVGTPSVSKCTRSRLSSKNDSSPSATHLIKVISNENDESMNSEEDSSAINRSLKTSQMKANLRGTRFSAESSPFGNGRRKKSAIWNYFTPVNEQIASCNYCPLTVPTQMFNLKQHLILKHATLDEITQQLKEQQKKMDDVDSIKEETDPEQQESNEPENEIKDVALFNPSHNRRKRTSHLWNYFTRKEGMMAECNTCKSMQSYQSSVTNLKKHLIRRHPSIYLPHRTKHSDENEELPSESNDEPVTTPQGEITTNKKWRKKKSILWHFFNPLDENVAECNICLTTKSYRTSTSNLKKHLTTAHPSLDLTSQKFLDFAEKHKFQQLTVAPETQAAVIAAMNEQEDLALVLKREDGSDQNIKQHRRTSYLWEYFTRIDSEIARCKICSVVKSFRSSISNLKKHLLTRHPSVDLPVAAQDYQQKYRSQPSGVESEVILSSTNTGQEITKCIAVATKMSSTTVINVNSQEEAKKSSEEITEENTQETTETILGGV